MRLTHGYCLQQAAWWQRQAAIEYEQLEAWQLWWAKNWFRGDPQTTWAKAKEGMNQGMRRQRIAHQTSRDYLDVAESLLRIETAVDSVII